MKRLIYFALLLILATGTQAQLVETTDFDSTLSTNGSSVLDQASLGYAGTSPNVTLKTYKLSALIGKSNWDLYVYNSVSAFTVAAQDSATALGHDILNQLGGLLNVSLSKMGYFANGRDKSIRDVKGGQIDFRLGGKMLDAYNRNAFEGGIVKSMVPLLQSTVDVRYLIPLVNPMERGKQNFNVKQSMLGNLSFRVYGSFMQVLNGEIFDRYYTTKRGLPPKHSFFTGNVEVNLFITDQFYISAGYSMSNQQEALPNRSFFSISYAN